jgi:aspartate kinase
LRPRYLEIEGLQSFKEAQTVDFDKLSETGLFGIFGPTGSGKSTVLDAITLALYGNVQRASHGTQGIINAESDSVKVSFLFDILRNNDRKTYRVERVYRRKKGSDISAEARLARLFELDNDKERVIADKVTEVTEKVEQLLGLKLDDFTRSVVLPQNKFQEFLLLEKVKKREMLERIFYLEEYGRQLTDKFNKRLSKVRTELAGIKGAMDALGDASEKVLLEAEARMKTARETREKVDKELKLAELKFNEAKEVWNLSNDYKQAMEKERLHLSRLDDIAAKRERYENSIKAGDLGDVISKYREVSKSLTDTTALLEEVNRKLPEFEKELEDAKSRLNSNRKEADIEKPRLIEVRAKLNEALAVKKDISSIKERLVKLGENYSKLKGEISTKESEINDIKVHLEAAEKSEEDLRTVADNLKVNIDYRNELLSGVKLDEDLKNAKKEKEKLGLEINDLSRKVKELTNKLENVKAENKGLRNKLLEMKTTRVRLENQKQGDRTAILNEINNCHKIKVALETLKAKRAEVDGLRLKLDKMSIQVSKQKERLQNKQNNKAELEDILAKEKTRVEVLEERYEKNTAYMLAKNLTAGEPCPVCGSVHHPNPADKIEYPDMGKIEEQLKTAREEYSMAEQNSREAENECIKLAEQLKGLNSQVSQISNELLVKQNEYESLADQLPGYYRTMEIEKIEAAVNILAEQNNKRLEAIESREQQLNEVKNEILKLNDILSRKLADENGLKAELKVNGENLLQTQSLLKNAETEYIQCLEAYNGFLGRLGIANIQDELKRIEENDRQMEKLQSKIKQCQEKQRSLRKAQEHLEEKKTNLRNIFIEIENLKNLRNMPGIKIFPGFFGYSLEGDVVTFSRGGSDITGSILAAAVEADLYENFTDVDSIYAVDPNIIENPHSIRELTYREMRELSYSGFGVFHEEALIPVYRKGIPVRVLNTNNPDAQGTTILLSRSKENRPVVGIASGTGFCSIYISKYLMNREIGFGRKLLQILEEEGLSYEHTPSGIDNISVILKECQFSKAIEERVIKHIKDQLSVDDIAVSRNQALIMVVGEGMQRTVGIAARITGALAKAGVNIEMINQGSSEVSMMFGVKEEDNVTAVKAIYEEFFGK